MQVPERKSIHQVYLDRAIRIPNGSVPSDGYSSYGKERSLVPDRGIRHLDATPLQRAYFSDENARIIQNTIRYQVWERSGQRHLISPQNEQDLRIVMRAVFIQSALHLPDQIPKQIADLNAQVVAIIVPKVMDQIEGYIRYLEDASRPLQIQDHPLHVSSAGTKSLEWGREAAAPFSSANFFPSS